jgi:methyltransferase (TIGR00027 family)
MAAIDMGQLASNPPNVDGVGQTSLLIAAWRSRESEQIDPLFVDPIANIFVNLSMEDWVDKMTQASVSTRHLIGYRTRYFDDYLASEMNKGVAQIVLLGAGLDTRSLRLGHPSASFYEIDRREVLAYKQEQLGRHGYAIRSHFIDGDYIRDDVFALLDGRGFKADEETYLIWEGNTMYVPVDAIISFLSGLKAKIQRFRISFDYLSEEMIQRKTGYEGAGDLVNGFESIGAPWVTGFGDIHRIAERTGLAVIENKWMVDVVAPSPFRVALSRDLFRHYSVCTLGSHE